MSKPATDPTERFFAELAARGHEPLLRKASGATCFEVVDGRRTRRWLVAVERGDVTVTRGGGDAFVRHAGRQGGLRQGRSPDG